MGPYNPNHGTNGTLAYKKSYGKTHKYDETVQYAEEKSFLDNHVHPMVQLEPFKVMLVIAHSSNTYSKDAFRDNGKFLKSRIDAKEKEWERLGDVIDEMKKTRDAEIEKAWYVKTDVSEKAGEKTNAIISKTFQIKKTWDEKIAEIEKERQKYELTQEEKVPKQLIALTDLKPRHFVADPVIRDMYKKLSTIKK